MALLRRQSVRWSRQSVRLNTNGLAVLTTWNLLTLGTVIPAGKAVQTLRGSLLVRPRWAGPSPQGYVGGRPCGMVATE